MNIQAGLPPESIAKIVLALLPIIMLLSIGVYVVLKTIESMRAKKRSSGDSKSLEEALDRIMALSKEGGDTKVGAVEIGSDGTVRGMQGSLPPEIQGVLSQLAQAIRNGGSSGMPEMRPAPREEVSEELMGALSHIEELENAAIGSNVQILAVALTRNGQNVTATAKMVAGSMEDGMALMTVAQSKLDELKAGLQADSRQLRPEGPKDKDDRDE